jgi:hypothetical protein
MFETFEKREIFIALMMEADSTSETSVGIYQTTRSNISEGTHIDGFRRFEF